MRKRVENMKKYLLFSLIFVAGLAFAADPIVTEGVSKNVAQALTKQGDTIKIPSNAHSNAAADLGITFEWNTKQKDDCVLTVKALEDGTFYSFTLLIQSSGEYTAANITSPGDYEVAKGAHNINMVYVVDAKLTIIDPCDGMVCGKGKVCKAGKCEKKKNTHRKHKKNTDKDDDQGEDDDDQGEDNDDQGEDNDDQGEDNDDQGEDNDDQGEDNDDQGEDNDDQGNSSGNGGTCDIEDEDGNYDQGCQGDQGNKGGNKGGGGNQNQQ
jgi:hypothetical protein